MTTSRPALLPAEEAAHAAASADIDDRKAQTSLYRALLNQPHLAKRVSDLIDTLMMDTVLDPRLRELIVMRLAWSKGCVYTWTQHWRIAPIFGVEEEHLLAVRDWEDHNHWSSADRAALLATDETLSDGVISPDTWDHCIAAFPTAAERLELVLAIGSWKMMSEVLQTLMVPLEDGVVPWPPDGLGPNRPGGATETNGAGLENDGENP